MGRAIVRYSDSEQEPDRRLLARSANGDQAAFRQIVERRLPAVVSASRRILGDGAEAEDVAQEVFVRLWSQALSLTNGELNLPGWLRQVAVNLSLDRIRARRRLDVRDELPELAQAANQLTGLEELEASSRVTAALDQLPDRQRIAIALFHFEERSQKDVAQVMGISEDALESLLARGRRNLRALLENDWQDLLAGLRRPDAEEV